MVKLFIKYFAVFLPFCGYAQGISDGKEPIAKPLF